MGDLRDAFKKAGLIDDKTDRRLKHEERVQRKELGHEGLEEQKRRDDAERQSRDEQKKQDIKAAQQKLDQERQRSERWKKLVADLEREALRGISGPRRFHYHDAEDYLPYLQVDDDTGRKLEAGELAIAKHPETKEALIVPRAVALELAKAEPGLVVHLAGGRG
jgi:uncharacterized protein YaiL (DUF2058 family)